MNDAEHEASFRAFADSYPGRAAIRIGYDESTAHRLLAGADILLHPSRFEPCGLVPLYAMRYGTVPVVRRCGGLVDSIVEVWPDTVIDGTATGFVFDDATADSMLTSMNRALSAYRQPLLWRKIRAAGMARDFGWGRAAAAYEDVYRKLVGVEATLGDQRELNTHCQQGGERFEHDVRHFLMRKPAHKGDQRHLIQWYKTQRLLNVSLADPLSLQGPA